VNVEGGGIPGACEATGTGPPLVLIASPLARVETYRPTAARLARTFRVFAVGLPGSGRGARLGRDWSVGQYADWVAGLIEAKGVDHPTVVGHSHGASVAVVLAARHPHRVGRLVLADATGTGPHPIGRVVLGSLCDAALDIGLVLRAWHHVAGNLVRHPVNFRRQVRDAVTADVRAYAARVAAPVLIAWGRRDHTLPPSNAREYARCVPGARVHVSLEGSHAWVISRADEFGAAVEAFAAAT
jgi:pimeloyl-ACP methyl ester carboxylesterase